MARSSITETVQRVQGLVDQVKALEPDEQGFFLDLLLPEPQAETKPSAPAAPVKRRKIEHCVACNWTKRAAVHKDSSVNGYHPFQSGKTETRPPKRRKSERGIGIQQDLTEADTSENETCADCEQPPDHNIHHLTGHQDYHEFKTAA